MRLGTVLLGVLLLAGCGAEASPNRVQALPSAWLAASSDRVVIGWALRPEDVISCVTAAREIRQLRAHFGDQVVVSVVVAGKEIAFVESFLRTEKLHGVSIQGMDRRSFDASFGTELPAIYVVREGVTRLRLQADRAALTRGDDAGRLEEAIGAVVQQYLAAG